MAEITVGEVISEALLLCQGLDQDEPVEGAATAQTVLAVNNILRHWQTRGLHQWRKQEIVLPLVTSQAMYLLGSAATDAFWAEEEDFFSTTVATAATLGSATLIVTSAANYVNGDFVGVELSDGTRQWTTATKASNTLTLVATLTANVAVAASVYFFTTRPSRPLRVIHARRRSSTNATDIPVRIEAHNYYEDQPSKTSTGTPVHVYYKPSLTSGRLFVWQPSNAVTQQLRLIVERPFTLVASASDTLDMPDYCNLAMIHQVAMRLEPTYGHLDPGRRRDLRQDALMLEGEALGFDAETGSIYFEPARR